MYELERSLPQEEASRRIENFLRAKGYVVEPLGSDDEFLASIIKLHRARGVGFSYGCGKGENHRLGALAEALEHDLSERRSKPMDIAPLAYVAEQSAFSCDSFLQSVASQHREATIAVERFRRFEDDALCLVPAAYVNPKIYDRPEFSLNEAELLLSRFSCNNGAALGSSATDALLHGLNETIERHYEALLYQDILGVRDMTLDWVRFDSSFSPELAVRHEQVRSLIGETFTLSCDTAYGNHVAISVGMPSHASGYCHIGAGCSEHRELALLRSLDEVAQCHFLAPWDETEIEDAVSSLTKYSGLDNLLRVEHGKLFELTRPEVFQTPHQVELGTPDQQLARRVSAIVAQGGNPLFQIIEEDEDLTVSQVFVPSFDKFFVIRRGSIVAPAWAYG
jgi:ribosomal protein S12 methylthiotransferase accessory factor